MTIPNRARGETAAPLVPPRPTLPALREAAAECQACDLWRRGTQTVFGEGAAWADVMLVGEQPGDQEDLQGQPFVGPAGKLLDRALEAAARRRRCSGAPRKRLEPCRGRAADQVSDLKQARYVRAAYRNVTERTLYRELLRLGELGLIGFTRDNDEYDWIVRLDFDAIGKY